MSSFAKTFVRVCAVGLSLAAGSTGLTSHCQATDFRYDDDTSAYIRETILNNAPVYFAVPDSARLKPLQLPDDLNSDVVEGLMDFRHPDGVKTPARPGLRIITATREGFGAEMARTGLIQPGDLLLWFDPKWAGGGAYPSVNMGVSHAGMAYLKDGTIRNIDNPINSQIYFDASTDGSVFGGSTHKGAMLHVIRPRGLSDQERAVISKWADRFHSVVAQRFYVVPTPKNATEEEKEKIRKINDSKLFTFDAHYNRPLYTPGTPLTFVQRLGQIGMIPEDAQVSRSSQQPPVEALTMFCSEFAWSVLALRDCDPDTSADDFNAASVPQCIKPIMTPLPVTGHYLLSSATTQDIGVADGPMIAVDALNRPQDEADKLVDSMFDVAPGSPFAKPTVGGEIGLAQSLKPQFDRLRPYYKAFLAGGLEGFLADIEAIAIREAVPDNYSPASFLINTLLPTDSDQRAMDYVVTVKFVD